MELARCIWPHVQLLQGGSLSCYASQFCTCINCARVRIIMNEYSFPLQVESLLSPLQFSIMKVPVKGRSGNTLAGRHVKVLLKWKTKSLLLGYMNCIDILEKH